ncbi:MAG: ABC transporter ATP-binding protein [Deltaproteobacteria bacterium]|nr:ABC transporter ATP-binding protein [Deltaproteobacteria bacterium]
MEVSLRTVGVSYGGRAVLADVSLELSGGALTAILGPNGSGKSTLLRAIAGLVPIEGGLSLGERSVEGLDRRERARCVAFLPQRGEIPAGFTVAEVVAMGRAPHQDAWHRPGPDDARAVAEALAACELSALADRGFEALSGGEQQRAHLARVLAQGAPVLLLDEPTSQLDLRHARACHELLRRCVDERGLTCVVAMHDLTAAARFADQVVLLDAGRVLASGAPDEVMTGDLLGRAFGSPIEVARGPDGRPMFSAA